MAKPYPIELRERAMARLRRGQTSEQAAEALGISKSAVIKWAQRLKATGNLAPGQMGGHRPFEISEQEGRWVQDQLARTPHMTLRALAAALRQRGTRVSHMTVGRFLKRTGKSFKKNPVRN